MMAPTAIQTTQQLINLIEELWQGRSVKNLQKWLQTIQTEAEFYHLIRLADEAELYGYSNLLATQAYKRFGTLRTFSWHCTRLLETGRSLEAEERMSSRLKQVGSTNSPDDLAAAHALLLKVFCQLNRIDEAKKQLKRIEEVNGHVQPDLEAYYLLSAGEREQAERLLEGTIAEGTSDRLDYAQLIYADVLELDGRHEQSLEALLAGDARSGYRAFQSEQVKRLFHLGRYEDAIAKAQEVIGANPFHANKDMFIYVIADCYYRLERWEELEAWLAANKKELGETIFGKVELQPTAKWKRIEMTPEVQKLNYCVPASLSLMVQAFGKKIGQDEIATHVFDVTGSKLKTTMEYMESLGLTARYFKGTVDTYKQLLDADVPILLSMLIENNAHVQVVVGYDDRLQVLLIQDPNDLGPFMLPYTEVEKAYKMSDNLSMVFIDEQRQELLELLDPTQHQFFHTFFEFLERSEEQQEADEVFLAFLQANVHERYAAIIGLLSMFTDGAKELHGQWIAQLEGDLGKDDSNLALLAAHTHYHNDEHDKVLARLKEADLKTPYALFLKAVSLQNTGRTEEAVPLLKQSIELDHYQPVAYSYLAKCYQEMGRETQAFKWSSVALSQLPTDHFVQITHGLIQFESGAIASALERFQKLSDSELGDPYFHYEIGRCLDVLGRFDEAEKAFRRTIELNSKQPFAFLRLADRKMAEEAWEEAEAIIAEGLTVSDQKGVLHLYNGHILTAQDRYEEAEQAYRLALTADPADLYIVTHIAHALIKQGKTKQAEVVISEYEHTDDASFFIRTASMLWDEGDMAAEKELALKLLEDTINKRSEESFYEACERYADFGEEINYRGRVMKLFRILREREPEAELLVLEGMLYEQEMNQAFAGQLYTKALEMKQLPGAWYRLGILAEEKEQYEEAARCFSNCAALDAGHADSFASLYVTYKELGEKEAALTAAMHLLELEPLTIQLDEMFGLIDAEQQLQEIEQRVESVSEHVPAEWFYVVQARIAEARGDFRAAESLFVRAGEENGAFPSRYQFVHYWLRRGDFKRALRLLEELIVEQPGEQDLYQHFMQLLIDQKKAMEVHKRLKKMMAGEELGMAMLYCADAWLELITENEEQEQQSFLRKIRSGSSRFFATAGIIALYEDAARRMPENELPPMRLADFYMNRELAKDALKELEPFVERTGNRDAGKMLLQIRLFQASHTGDEKWYEATAELAEQLLKKEPGDIQLLLISGDAQAALSQFDGAVERYEQVIAYAPLSEDGYVRLLQMAEHLPDQARKAAAALPQEIADMTIVRLSVGMMHTGLGEGLAARESLALLLQEEPDYAPAYYEMARAEMVFGNHLAARDMLTKLEAFDEGEQLLAMAAADPLLESLLHESSPYANK